jgi:hypothetical protein
MRVAAAGRDGVICLPPQAGQHRPGALARRFAARLVPG